MCNRLVHQRPAAVERPSAPPGAAVVILLGAKPLDVGVAQGQPAKPALVDRLAHLDRRIVKPRGKDRPQLDALLLALADDAVATLESDFQRLFDDDVLARTGGRNGRFHVGAAGRGHVHGVDVGVGKHRIEVAIGRATNLLGKFLCRGADAIVASHQLRAADVFNGPRVKAADHSSADNGESVGHGVELLGLLGVGVSRWATQWRKQSSLIS